MEGYILIKNSKTNEKKYFLRRKEFIEWLKSQNNNVSETVINRSTKETLLELYAKDWYKVI